jgi:hypothetical protein
LNAKSKGVKFMSVYIELSHGRLDPDQDMEDSGFMGPILGPFSYVHTVYGHHIDAGESVELEMDRDGLINYGGAYYSDWTVVAQDLSRPLAKSVIETQTVIATKDSQLPASNAAGL